MTYITFYELIRLSLCYDAMTVQTPQFTKILWEKENANDAVRADRTDSESPDG